MKHMKSALLVALLFAIVVGACAPAAQGTPTATSTPTGAQTGTLRGHVTVGPLQPVEREGVPTPTPNPEVYTTRSLNVFKQDGTTLVKNVPFKADGTYEGSLPAGTYVVDIKKQGIDHAGGLPQTVTIKADETVVLDIDIDTGIR